MNHKEKYKQAYRSIRLRMMLVDLESDTDNTQRYLDYLIAETYETRRQTNHKTYINALISYKQRDIDDKYEFFSWVLDHFPIDMDWKAFELIERFPTANRIPF